MEIERALFLQKKMQAMFEAGKYKHFQGLKAVGYNDAGSPLYDCEEFASKIGATKEEFEALAELTGVAESMHKQRIALRVVR